MCDNCQNSTCYQCNQPTLCVTNDCSCPVKDLSTDCILYTGDDLACSGIKNKTILTDLIQQLDEFICNLTGQSTVLINIGTGAKVYKGVDLQGRKEIRTLIVSSQNGGGESILRDTQENASDITIRLKKIKSNTLSIQSTDTEVSIELPESSQIPALYVNNSYIPTYSEWVSAGGNLATNPNFLYKGVGTLSKPFTDSIRYTSTTLYAITQNTSIQNALDAYVGDTGIYSKTNPEKSGDRITIQNNGSVYSFAGDFNYNNINILIEGKVTATTSSWLLDMDNLTIFPTLSETTVIKLSEEGALDLPNSLGFRNSGNTSNASPAYDTGKVCLLLGDGLISTSYNGTNKLSRYLINSEGNFNDSNLHFQIKCRLKADYQGVYLAKNNCRFDFYNVIQSGFFSGSVDSNLEAFRMTGGQVRFYDKGSINIEGINRLYGITFEPTSLGINNCTFLLNSAKVNYNCNYLFAKLNNENVSFTAIGSGGSGATTQLNSTTVVNGLFENLGSTKWSVAFRDCSYTYTGIDFNKVDLTLGNNISSVNTIGNNVVETLVVFNNRANAIAAGLPLYSAFLNRDNAGVSEGAEVNGYPLTSKWFRDIVLPA